ncbi:SDR family NAD(P)-dependent oxidoreductase [Roseofilum reptotaenium CS-1145]|uniref:Oxidoreductase n=1 Tax=Roseofilum reptotaenium AO1-A TaxID=1925591 RepID=A0A1L9QLK1_9CYAN|nr:MULTISPECIES: SDR family oxidoreductase [Roseofilum]MBP0027139.1 SDR family oxidoreductase [Roseofilum sp. Guam]MDB9517255.1 SDR family NAD(P)-dependent oxidoreductase [Roseofilum reptotaenium CS-1145]OJJ19738.1 oxidoreductase [Roseofilum reptotaenium AO1-A]
MSKIILITGVSRGLGRAMAEQFIQLGHTVMGCARNQKIVEELNQNFSKPHNFMAVDVTDDLGINTWSQRILSEYEPPDLLINSAAVPHPRIPLWEISTEEFDRTIDVNIKGVANIIRHFVPAMVAQKRGVIVNFSAGWGRYTAANAAPYCASKWAIEGLTGALAQELPSGMAAVSLWPGTIHTDTLEYIYGAEKAAGYISPQTWAQIAVPFLLQIGASDNGKPLSIPTG